MIRSVRLLGVGYAGAVPWSTLLLRAADFVPLEFRVGLLGDDFVPSLDSLQFVTIHLLRWVIGEAGRVVVECVKMLTRPRARPPTPLQTFGEVLTGTTE